MLEHVRFWKTAISNMKNVIKPEGYLLITTRSKGFPKHNFPHDFWRYETDDMQWIFRDMDILSIEMDPSQPGIFIFARKPKNFSEAGLDDHVLYNMEEGKRC